MKMICDAPDEVIKSIKDGTWCGSSVAEKMIANGIPLPKGYGKLVDVLQCDKKLFYQQCGGADALITVKSAFDMLMSLPPIIEADKAEGSGEE